MNRVVLLAAGAALALSLGACDRAGAPADGNAAPAAASATDAEAVKTAFAALNAAIAAKDLPAIKAQYASDAVMVFPNQAPYRGAEAIMADYAGFAADAGSKYVPGAETTVVSSGGDLAYGQVTYDSTGTNATTKAVESTRRYNLTVYKKQADGSWKIVQDINADVPKAS